MKSIPPPNDHSTRTQPGPLDIAIAGLTSAIRERDERIKALAALAESLGDDVATYRLILQQAITYGHDVTIERDRERGRYYQLLDQYRQLLGSLASNPSEMRRAA